MQELTIGAFGASIVLSIILRMVYNSFNINNKFKPWLAVGIGMVLGIVAMFYNGFSGFKPLVDYLLSGFMTGATSVGLYEMTKTRSPG